MRRSAMLAARGHEPARIIHLVERDAEIAAVRQRLARLEGLVDRLLAWNTAMGLCAGGMALGVIGWNSLSAVLALP